jgi:hypothetical protein
VVKLPQSPPRVYRLLAIGTSCGRARPKSIGRAKVGPVFLSVPALFAEDAEPSVTDLVAKGLDLFSVDVAAHTPVLSILIRKRLHERSLIGHRLNWWEPRNSRSVDSRLAGRLPRL